MAEHHRWSKKSLRKLESCDLQLQLIMHDVIKYFPHDVTIIEGHRSSARQNILYDLKKTTLRGGQSKHNKVPSDAVDIAPIVNGFIDWKDRELWVMFAGFVIGIAATHGVKLRWGGDWDSDFDSAEHGFWDGPHFEIVR